MKAPEIARQAAELVGGDRAESYGPMADNFGRIAALWTCFLAIRKNPDSPLSPEDVGHMMALLKMARTQSGPYSADSYVDLCGYAACAGEIAAGNRSQ